MTRGARAAAAGAAAATVWGLLEPLDQRILRCAYSDVEIVGRGNRKIGFVVHALNGAIFGLAFDIARSRVALWPLMGLVRPQLVANPRAFAQSRVRHALFGVLLGRLA